MSIDLSQFHQSFFEEAQLCLDQAEASLLAYERGEGDADTLDSAFRAIHSIKGSASTLGFNQIGEVSHELESVLDSMRNQLSEGNNAQDRDSEKFAVILASIDLLGTQINAAMKGQLEIAQSRVDALISNLQRFSDETQSVSETASYFIRLMPSQAMLNCGNDPLTYIDALDDLGELEIEAFWDDIENPSLSWDIRLKTLKTKEEIDKLFAWLEGEVEICLDSRLDEGSPSIFAAPSSRTTSNSKELRSTRGIQVAPEKIDRLLYQLGELAQVQVDLENKLVSVPQFEQTIQVFLQQLSRQTSQLQDAILAMRMSPISTLFRRFDRVVRDAEQDFGKTVQLQLHGEASELDSSVIEQLIDPLTHLIRNALDHGIETPERRIALGKPPIANLTLSAEQRSSTFVISIQDDGQGLNISKIKERATSQGLAH